MNANTTIPSLLPTKPQTSIKFRDVVRISSSMTESAQDSRSGFRVFIQITMWRTNRFGAGVAGRATGNCTVNLLVRGLLGTTQTPEGELRSLTSG